MVAFLAAQAVQCSVTRLPQVPGLAVLDDTLVDTLARLQGYVQLVAELADKADAKSAHEFAVRTHQLRGGEGELVVSYVLVDDVLQDFLATKRTQRKKNV